MLELRLALVTFVFLLSVSLAPSHARAQADADPSVVGQWGPVFPWRSVAINVHLLPNGTVLTWPRNQDQQAAIWDPKTNRFTAVQKTVPTDLFCTGGTFLSDGRLLITGGRGSGDGIGLTDTDIFDYRNHTWTRLPAMNAGRWYPTNVTLADGQVLVVGGSIDNRVGINTIPQVINPPGAWRTLTTASYELSLYPWMFLTWNGVFNSGPDQLTRYLDTSGTGTWTDLGQSNFGYRDYGSSVMYDDGKILIAGGHDPPTATAEVINLYDQTPQWRTVASMAYARRMMNAVLLPEGEVLIVGGTSSPGFNDGTGSVLAAEIWNPWSETFTTVASMAERRLYHSTALLLPDGRVLVAGGGQPAADGIADQDHTNAQLYSPPYLFWGTRPRITSAPSSARYGASIRVPTPDAANIGGVVMLRLGSVTHSFNTGQRIWYPDFTVAPGALTVSAPYAPEIAPPGYYMLFLLSVDSVPSQAKIIRIF